MSGRKIAGAVVGVAVTVVVAFAASSSGSAGNVAASIVCPGPDPPDVTHAPPSEKLRQMLAPLRRPPAPSDAAPLDQLFLANLAGIEVDYIRLVRRLGGVRYYLIPAQRLADPLPQSCIDQLPPRQRQIEDEWKQQLERHPREQIEVLPVGPAASSVHQAQSEVFFGGPGCGVGGPADELSKQPEFATCSVGPHPRSSLAIELVPDKVASLRVFYPREVPGRKRAFKSEFKRTVRVHHNVALFRVPRPLIYSFPARTTWLSHNGTVIHRFRDS